MVVSNIYSYGMYIPEWILDLNEPMHLGTRIRSLEDALDLEFESLFRFGYTLKLTISVFSPFQP